MPESLVFSHAKILFLITFAALKDQSLLTFIKFDFNFVCIYVLCMYMYGYTYIRAYMCLCVLTFYH